jgi:hypothetical protein
VGVVAGGVVGGEGNMNVVGITDRITKYPGSELYVTLDVIVTIISPWYCPGGQAPAGMKFGKIIKHVAVLPETEQFCTVPPPEVEVIVLLHREA